jgi:hypothetical protein
MPAGSAPISAGVEAQGDSAMKKLRTLVACSVVLLVLGTFPASFAESASEAQLLAGNVWQTLSRDNKIAYVWGIGNLVELERINLGMQPLEPPTTTDRKSFLPYLMYGLSGIPIEEIVNHIDAYYTTHPDQRSQPVLDAIFQTIVKPRLKAAQVGARNR